VIPYDTGEEDIYTRYYYETLWSHIYLDHEQIDLIKHSRYEKKHTKHERLSKGGRECQNQTLLERFFYRYAKLE
jgi:hypothetical protein